MRDDRAAFVLTLIDQLQREHGPCPAPRVALVTWVDAQLNRCAALHMPGEAALQLIASGYVAWCAELLELEEEDEDDPDA